MATRRRYPPRVSEDVNLILDCVRCHGPMSVYVNREDVEILASCDSQCPDQYTEEEQAAFLRSALSSAESHRHWQEFGNDE